MAPICARLSEIPFYFVQAETMFKDWKTSGCIQRHYVHSIVGGKKTKSVEFAEKIDNIQINGISLIEHISFKVFNEDIRVKYCICMYQKLKTR